MTLIILLAVGAFALGIPIQLREYPESRRLNFYWKGFSRGMPRWVPRVAGLLWLIAIVHFVWFAFHSGRGYPTILDGQYVTDDHGHVLKVLTYAEYLSLKKLELRGVACTMAACYFVPLMYWRFRRSDQA